MSNNKIALITGASRGIGKAAALKLANIGYDIVVNYCHNEDAAKQVVSQVEALGRQAIAIKADIGVEAEIIALFEQIDDSFGALHALVNNAGILLPQTKLVDMDAARINKLFNVNVTGSFIACREAIKRMSTQFGGDGGAIVNVSSAAARLGGAHEYIDYAATKGAIDTLTIGLALELAEQGIRVNGVRPGFIDTDMHADGGEPNRIERVKNNIPLKRGGTANEIANAITWLVSDEASYCTGSIIDCAGGR